MKDSKKKEPGKQRLTADQAEAMQLMESGRDMFLTGAAGSGKSFLLRRFIDAHEGKVIVCAPTGIAAVNIGGVTMHRLFNIPAEACPKPGKKHLKVLEHINTIIIDEISMCRIDVFDYAMRIVENEEKKQHRHIQVILCGDFLQLPPVVPEKETRLLRDHYGEDIGKGYCFMSKQWAKRGFVVCNLTTVVRQIDPEFCRVLDLVRTGDEGAVHDAAAMAGKASHDPKAVTICGTNKEVSEGNEAALSALPGFNYIIPAVAKGEVKASDVPCEMRLELKDGCRVMLLANLSRDLVNGSLGTIRKIGVNSLSGRWEVTVDWDNGGRTTVMPYIWKTYKYDVISDKNGEMKTVRIPIGSVEQIPLKVSYYITAHKGQGQTYDSVNIELRRTFATGQLYVALSRARSAREMYFSHGVQIRELADPLVLAFYEANGMIKRPPVPARQEEDKNWWEMQGEELDSPDPGSPQEADPLFEQMKLPFDNDADNKKGRDSLAPATTRIEVPLDLVDQLKAMIEELKKTEN